METIFDYDPTPEELRYLWYGGVESYLEGPSVDRAFHDLCTLFALRGDEEPSTSYARRMSDQDYVRFNLINYDLIPSRLEMNSSSRADNKSKAA
jgi:hypothetical protein